MSANRPMPQRLIHRRVDGVRAEVSVSELQEIMFEMHRTGEDPKIDSFMMGKETIIQIRCGEARMRIRSASKSAAEKLAFAINNPSQPVDTSLYLTTCATEGCQQEWYARKGETLCGFCQSK